MKCNHKDDMYRPLYITKMEKVYNGWIVDVNQGFRMYLTEEEASGYIAKTIKIEQCELCDNVHIQNQE